jgi:hypothetical protein
MEDMENMKNLEDTERFAGGLGEAVNEAMEEGEDGAAVGWQYEEEGLFNIALR